MNEVFHHLFRSYICPNRYPFCRFFFKFGLLRLFLKFMAELCPSFNPLFVAFIVLKMTILISRFHCKNRFEKLSTLTQDIWANIFRPFARNSFISRAILLLFTYKFLRQTVYTWYTDSRCATYKIGLRMWDQDGQFEYYER